jgi:ribosomal protein L11 methyltransferase
MMLEFLLEMNIEGKSIVDMGCGTGVLAILAYMKGASNIIAIDIDSWAYENAKDNVKANNANSIQVIRGDVQALNDVHADIIIANINKNILLNDIPGYANSLSDGGHLLLSGFYQSDLREIKTMCSKKGLVFVSERTMNEWTAAMFKLNTA